MSIIEYLGWAIGIVLALYIAARVISAAYFRSKRDHDTRNYHGTQKHQPPRIEPDRPWPRQ